MKSDIDLDKLFTYHPPKGSQPIRYEEIRAAGKNLAFIIGCHCPESRERTIAIARIEEAVMWANAAIARNESEPQTVVSPDGKSFMDVPRPARNE